MKKLKLLLAACALFGVSAAWAQTDVTSTYITNPGFEGESTIHTTYSEGTSNERYIIKPNGWTVVLTNPNTNDITCLTAQDKQASSFSSWTMKHSGDKTYWVRLRWGGQVWKSSGTEGNPTSIELQQQMTLPNGVYRLKADLLMYAAGTEANNHTYLKAISANNSWSVEPTINHSKSDNNWETKDLLITSSGSTEYTISLQALQNWNQGNENIFAFDDVKLEKYTVDADHTLDITSIVPTGTGNWTNNDANNAGTFSNGGVDMVERYYAQHYTGTVSELVVKDLAQGVYDAEVYCQAHCADWNCSAIAEAAGQTDRTILSGNNVEVGIPIVNDKNLTEGPQVRTLTGIKVTNGTLTFKVRNDQEGANWLTFEIKSLTYKGVDLTEIKASYNTAKDAAIAARDNDAYSTITGAERQALVNAINADVEEDADAYIAATNTLIAATAAFSATTVANYALLATEKTKAAALGMNNEAIATATPNTKTGLEATQSLKVAEYNFVTTNYQYGVALGEWTSSGSNKGANFNNEHWSGETRNYKNQDDSNGQGWNSSSWDMDYNQDVTLPAGNYVFKVAARQASSDQITTSLVVKNGGTVLGSVDDFPRNGNTARGIDKTGATKFDGEDSEFAHGGAGFGWEWRYVKFTLASDATVNIAVKAVATASYMWVSFGDYTLQTDNEANISLIAYNIALNDAQTALANNDYKNVTGSEKTDLQSAIDADGTLDKTDKDKIEAAKTNLESKTTAFTSAKASYDAFVAAKAVVYADDLPYASATKFAAIATFQSAENATSAIDAESKTAAIISAYRKYVESNALAEGVTSAGDKTNLITDPNLDVEYDSENHKFGAWQVIGQTNGTIQLLSGESFTDGDGNANYKYADIYKNDNNAGIQQTINLEPGKYMLTVTARANTTAGATFRVFAGGKTADIQRIGNSGGVFDRGWNDASVEFAVYETGDVNIGVQSGNGKDLWWSATRFRLVKLPATEIEIKEDATQAPDASDFANVTLERAFNAGWNAVCLPFATAAFNDADIYEFTSETGTDNVTLNFSPALSFEANKPYLVKFPNEVASGKTFKGVNVAPAEVKVSQTEFAFEFKGVYAVTDIDAGNWVISGGELKKASATIALKPTRTYFAPKGASPARIAGFTVDGNEVTGLKAVMAQQGVAVDGIYNLKGQKVSGQLKKGIYVVEGKKVVK